MQYCACVGDISEKERNGKEERARKEKKKKSRKSINEWELLVLVNEKILLFHRIVSIL